MKRTTAVLISVAGLVLCISGIALAQTKSESRSEKLEEHEYATVALIYNQELAALYDEALYPVCILTPIGTNNNRLLHYLRHAGYPISNYHVCYPPNGRFSPNGDYPHGMSIIINNVHHTSNYTLDITIAIGDNTMHFERDLATTLRNGIYHFRLRENGEWELAGYTKEYDYRDKKEAGCR